MNVHAIEPKTFTIWAAYSYEPDHGDEAAPHMFYTARELQAFKDGIEYAGEDATWWEAAAEGDFFYCIYCYDWCHAEDRDDFDERHPNDDH